MIDWLTIFVPFNSDSPICSGYITSTDEFGELDFRTLKRLSVCGSYESSVTVRSVFRSEFDSGARYNALEISGNPSKYFQGHNVFGTDDICALAQEFVKAIFESLDVENFSWVALMATCSAILTRVDINYSYHLGSPAEVKQWLYSAESSATMKHRGRGVIDKGTLYFGKGSKRSVIKFYHKGQEIVDNRKHHFVEHPVLTDFANRSLRCELKLGSLELKSLNLSRLYNWSSNPKSYCAFSTGVDVFSLFNKYLSKLEFNFNMKHQTIKDLSGLTPKQLSIYALWKDGHDIKVAYSKSSFYRFRRQILDAISVDIAVKPSDSIPNNVIPLLTVLEAKPAEIPQEAYDENLFFEPAIRGIVAN